MPDGLLNQFLAIGTAAQRAAFTPTPPTVLAGPDQGYAFYETDTGKLFLFDGAALVEYDPTASGAGSGDLLSTNNLSDLANAGTALTNLGVSAFAKTILDDANAAAVRATIGAGTGGGDASGPASSVDGHVAVFNSTTGKLLKDSGVAILANGAVITPTATPATNEVGYLGAPQNTQNGTYTTVMSDAGKHIYHTSGSAHTWTIDSNANVAYPIGTILTFVNENGGGVVTLAITSDTLRWGSSTGSRSLAANGTATALKVASTTWRLTGDGIT
jgi:hypothetical protein